MEIKLRVVHKNQYVTFKEEMFTSLMMVIVSDEIMVQLFQI